MSLVLDAGALLAIDRRDRQVGALRRVAQQERIAVRTSPAAVAQVWCHGARQAQLAQTLAGVAAPPLDLDTGNPCCALPYGSLLLLGGHLGQRHGCLSLFTVRGSGG